MCFFIRDVLMSMINIVVYTLLRDVPAHDDACRENIDGDYQHQKSRLSLYEVKEWVEDLGWSLQPKINYVCRFYEDETCLVLRIDALSAECKNGNDLSA